MKALDNRFYVKFMQLEIGLLGYYSNVYYLQLSKTNLKGSRSGYCTGAGTLVFYDSGYRSCYMRDLSHMAVIRKTLYLNSI